MSMLGRTAIALAMSLAATPAWAQTGGKDWSVTVGTGLEHAPEYTGGGDNTAAFKLYASGSLGPWSLGPEGFTYAFWETSEGSLSAGATYDGGRERGDLPANRQGVGDVDGGFALTAAGAFKTERGRLWTLDVAQSLGEGGLRITGGLRADFPLSQRVAATSGVNLTWASASHMKAYYGVTAGQSADSGLRQHNADSGFESIAFHGSATWRLSQFMGPAWNGDWAVVTNGQFAILTGSAGSSPIVESRAQIETSVFLTYTF